jgi:hypothetical protein
MLRGGDWQLVVDVSGPIFYPETSVTSSMRCAACQKSDDLKVLGGLVLRRTAGLPVEDRSSAVLFGTADSTQPPVRWYDLCPLQGKEPYLRTSVMVDRSTTSLSNMYGVELLANSEL